MIFQVESERPKRVGYGKQLRAITLQLERLNHRMTVEREVLYEVLRRIDSGRNRRWR